MASTQPPITVSVLIHVTPQMAWDFYITPAHITQWNQASDDWHCPKAEMDLKMGGHFSWRMEAKDGGMGFDFSGVFTEITPPQKLAYTLDDGREVTLLFEEADSGTLVTETFEPEEMNPVELQTQGWQAILNSFKKHVEQEVKLVTLNFSIDIKAPVEKVYQTMLDAEGYKQWTSAFNNSSHFIGSWEKGADIQFLGCDADGKMGGMVAKIKENIPNRFVSIRHYGMIENGEIITAGPMVDAWAGAHENYGFSEENGISTVKVSVDTEKSMDGYFYETYPKALDLLKEICEA